MTVSAEAIMQALSAIEDPDLHRDIVSLGFVQPPEIAGDVVSVRIVLTTPACPVRETTVTTSGKPFNVFSISVVLLIDSGSDTLGRRQAWIAMLPASRTSNSYLPGYLVRKPMMMSAPMVAIPAPMRSVDFGR